MWVQLTATKTFEVHGKMATHRAGDCVDVGKQTALSWIAEGSAAPLTPRPEGWAEIGDAESPRIDWDVPGEFMTLFTIPRAFCNEHNAKQRNALKSWALLRPRPRIILVCDDGGVYDAAKEFGCDYMPNVNRSRQGVPMLNSAFYNAVRRSNDNVFCYTNADCMFTSSLVIAAQRVAGQLKSFLMVGRRYSVNISGNVEFSRWWDRRLLEGCGGQDDMSAMDYFVFTRDVAEGIAMPNFIVGSPAWDNWLLSVAIRTGVPTVDASADVACIHHAHEKAWPKFGIRHNRDLACGISAVVNNTQLILKDGKLTRR